MIAVIQLLSMGEDGSPSAFELIPRWWFEPVVGLAGVLIGVLGLGAGSLLLEPVFRLLFGPPSHPNVTNALHDLSLTEYVFAWMMMAGLYLAVGFGWTYVYLSARDFDPEFGVERPDREGIRWTGGLVVLAPVLTAAGVLLKWRLGTTPRGTEWASPHIHVGSVSPVPAYLAFDVTGAVTLVVVAGVVGPAIGALFHGILQSSLRRVASPVVAAGTTGVAVGLIAAAGPVTSLGSVLAVGFAAVAGYALERTDNLLVPMVGYVVLNAVSLAAIPLVLYAEVWLR